MEADSALCVCGRPPEGEVGMPHGRVETVRRPCSRQKQQRACGTCMPGEIRDGRLDTLARPGPGESQITCSFT